MKSQSNPKIPDWTGKKILIVDEAGCDDYLPKPIRFDDLLNSIGKLINR